jgi:hypothetical protein
MTRGRRRQRLSSRLSHYELETIAICDVHERCIVASCCIIGMERVCFAMSVFASRLSHYELETIAICDVHERCIVASCCIIGMERVCFAMSVFAYSMCSECCITLNNK